MASLTVLLVASAAAPSAAELFALEAARSLFGSSGAQLWKVGAEPGEGLVYTKVGPKHDGSVLSTSTCMDSKRGVFYYVGGSTNSDCNLYGVAVADGAQASAQALPDAKDRDPNVPPMWHLACDENAGTVYALGDYDLPPPHGSMDNFPPPADRTIWRFDSSAQTLTGAGTLPGYAYQIHQDSGTMDSHIGAVNTNEGQVSFLTNRRDVFSYGVFPGFTNFIYNTASGEAVTIRESGLEGQGTPCAQVFDTKLDRFFGLCTSTVGLAHLEVPFSCWWTATTTPQLMQPLSDHSECETRLSSVDVNGRLAFFMLQEKLSTVSLDTGKIVSQSVIRTNHYDMYQHKSAAAADTDIVV